MVNKQYGTQDNIEMTQPSEPTSWDYKQLLQDTTKVGTAARIVSRWEQEWHKDGWDADEYQHVLNDILDMADAIADLQQQLADALTRLSGTEAAWDDIEQLMFGEDDDGAE